MPDIKTKGSLLASCATCTLLYMVPCHAQNAATAGTAASLDRAETGLEEIIVTAQRRETSLQRTPIAVTAVTGAELTARGASTLLDVQNFTPSLQIGSRGSQGSQQGSFAIRGIGVDAASSSPAVGIYVDEVYYPSGAGNLLGLFDVERIEVLRGPQGTLFGRNTIAGAIQFISVKPGREPTASIEATLGNFGRRDVTAAATMPIGETLSMRFAFQTTHRNGYVYDELNDLRRGNDIAHQARLQLRWTPSSRLTVDLKGEIVDQHNNGRAVAVLAVNPAGQLVGIARNPAILGPFAYLGPFDDRFKSTRRYRFAGFNGRDLFEYNYWSGQGAVAYDLSDAFTLKSISAYSRSKQKSLLDFDLTPAAIIQGFGANPGIINLFTQELQLNGRLLDDRLKLTSGLFYYNAKDADYNRGFTLGVLPDAIGFQLSNGDNVLKTRAIAAFAQGTFDVSDQFSLTLGLRYS